MPSYKQVRYNVAALYTSTAATGAGAEEIQQLHRVTSVNDSFEVPYQDAIQFGQLAPFSRESIGTPTPSLSFDYYAHNGHNEKQLGFHINGTGVPTGSRVPVLKEILDRTTDEKNYYILYVPEGNDAIGYDVVADGAKTKTIGIGNGYVTNYSISASVGDFVTSSVSIEGLNYEIFSGRSGNIPAINPNDGVAITDTTFTIPSGIAEAAGMPKVLRPGDIVFDFSGFDQMGAILDQDDTGKAHIQSFSLDIPLSRTPLERLGSNFAFSRELDFPINATLTVETNVSDLKTGALADLINTCGSNDFNASITLKGCQGSSVETQMVLDLRGLTMDSQSNALSVGGGGRTASLSFSVKIGGPQDLAHNVFIEGRTA